LTSGVEMRRVGERGLHHFEPPRFGGSHLRVTQSGSRPDDLTVPLAAPRAMPWTMATRERL